MSKIFSGKVVSNKMTKTLVVSVERKFRHSKYGKVIIKHKKYKVHNPEKTFEVGDTVSIVETRPISKDKHFIVHEDIKVEKSKKA